MEAVLKGMLDTAKAKILLIRDTYVKIKMDRRKEPVLWKLKIY